MAMAIFRVRAVNTAADSENKIHESRTAEQYGFAGALVPGVTVHGYMAQAAIEHFGNAWLEQGSMRVRLRQPVYDGEEIAIESREIAGRLEIGMEGDRAIATAWIDPPPSPPLRSDFAIGPLPPQELRPSASRETLAPGTILGTLLTTLDLSRAGLSEPLPAALGEDRRAHPAILLALANEVLVRNFVLGPWIHTSGELSNCSAALDGEEIEVRARVLDQFERKGHEFVVLEVLTAARDHLIQHVRHTAIWKPRPVHSKEDAPATV